MDIHYILLYHIQVDITTAQDEGKLIQQHKTWPCFTTKNNYVRNWISHFPISHSLSLIYIPFCHCWIIDALFDQLVLINAINVNGDINAPKSKLLTFDEKQSFGLKRQTNPQITSVEIQQWQGIESGFGTDAFGSGRKRPRHFDVGRIKLRVFFQLP